MRNWLREICGSGKVVLGAYCYADGPLFVRVSIAMDAIIADLVENLKEKPVLAYLCTPTDAHLCTSSSKQAAQDNLRARTSQQAVRIAFRIAFRWFQMKSEVALPGGSRFFLAPCNLLRWAWCRIG